MHRSSFQSDFIAFIPKDYLLFVMDRPNRNKKMTKEQKGALISMYQSGQTYSSIANSLNINVRSFD